MSTATGALTETIRLLRAEQDRLKNCTPNPRNGPDWGPEYEAWCEAMSAIETCVQALGLARARMSALRSGNLWRIAHTS